MDLFLLFPDWLVHFFLLERSPFCNFCIDLKTIPYSIWSVLSLNGVKAMRQMGSYLIVEICWHVSGHSVFNDTYKLIVPRSLVWIQSLILCWNYARDVMSDVVFVNHGFNIWLVYSPKCNYWSCGVSSFTWTFYRILSHVTWLYNMAFTGLYLNIQCEDYFWISLEKYFDCRSRIQDTCARGHV